MRMTLLSLLATALFATSAFAALPAPTDEAKQKAAETAAKAAAASKVNALLLCRAQNQAVADYQAAARKAGKTPAAADAPAACVDPASPAAAPAAATAPARKS